jgi:hypothetical protein
MTSAVEQGSLPLARKVEPISVSVDLINRRRDLLGAINLMFDASGLDDKEIYLSLEIDAGHFSNIRKGKSGCHFPTNKLQSAMDLCGNEAPLIWLARQRGYELVQIESETQRLLSAERAAREKVEDENRVLREVLQGRK